MNKSKKKLNFRFRFLEEESQKTERKVWAEIFDILDLFINENDKIKYKNERQTVKVK